VLKNEHTPSPAGMKERKNHLLAIDAAKEVCIVQGNEKGKLTRRYLIQTERKAQAAGIAPATTRTKSTLTRSRTSASSDGRRTNCTTWSRRGKTTGKRSTVP